MKKNEKLFDAIGQIDERYIAEALEPMHQESAGTSEKNKAAMPKKGNLFFYRQRRTVAAAAALVICIGAAGIAQWRLHSEEPGPEMAVYDTAGLSAEEGVALQAEDAAAVAPDADENQAAAADQNVAQGRTVNNKETCFAEIYLEVATVNSGKITWRIVNKSDTETVGWGTDYTLERFTENGWEIIENSEPASETQEVTLQGTDEEKQSQNTAGNDQSAEDGGQNRNAGAVQQAESSQAVAGETKEGTLDLAADGIRLEAGQYRLKKECRIFDDENSRQTELTAEFQVEP